MAATTDDQREPLGFWRAWLADVFDAWWIYLLTPAVLTVANFEGGMQSTQQLLIAYGVSLNATLCIGGCTQAAFVWGSRRGLSLPLHLHYPVYVVFGVGLGTELTLASLGMWANFDADEMRRGMWLIGGTAAIVLSALGLTYDSLRARARETELRAERARREALQAQLQAMRARMDPHFLFNALNTVAALIEEDPDAAIESVERLSELLRFSVDRAQAEFVPLRAELDATQAYLALEATRFGERLATDLQIGEAVARHLDELRVPPFCLQPLVENVVKHGVAHSRTRVHLRVQLRLERTDEAAALDDATLAITVTDDAAPSTQAPPSLGTAHQTLRTRLRLLYGPRAALETEVLEPGYRARLRLPALGPASGERQAATAVAADDAHAGPRSPRAVEVRA